MPATDILFHWITERESIRRKKEAGLPKPWTTDPILMMYRFCNVHREDDTVTRWIRTEWGKYVDDENYTAAIALARYINWPDTLAYIGYPSDWDADRLVSKLTELEKYAPKVWTSAYIVSTNGNPLPKIYYIITRVLTPMQKRHITPKGTLAEAHKELHSCEGVGPFMAGQIIADLKNTYGHPLNKASDFRTWCISGPGSKRGYNRLIGVAITSGIRERDFIDYVNYLRMEALRETGIQMDAQDMQNCLCEYDKYMRVKNKEGRPRQTYPGAK
jgi:hypothetical protein